jgi:hypothetical protein
VRRLASFPLSTRWRRVPKNSSYRQILKKGSFGAEEQRRNTSNAKSVEIAPAALSSVGRIASLCSFSFLGRFLAFYGFMGYDAHV